RRRECHRFRVCFGFRISTVGLIRGLPLESGRCICDSARTVMSANIPADLKYAKSHEWVRVEGDIATVGITDHAQHELTDVVFVELPATGRQVKAGEACAVVESV